MRFEIGDLPEAPLAAAAVFHADVLPLLEHALIAPLKEEATTLEPAEAAPIIAHDALPPEVAGDGALTLIFAPADYTHRAWRAAVVQALARAHAPLRINAVASDDARAIDAAEAYLDAAPGVTGQYWPLDGNGAGEVLS